MEMEHCARAESETAARAVRTGLPRTKMLTYAWHISGTSGARELSWVL